MTTFSTLLRCDGSTDRLRYQRNIAALGVGKAIIDLLVMAVHPEVPAATVALAWVDPFRLIEPWTTGALPWAIGATTLLFFSTLVRNTAHRLRDAGAPHWLGLAACAPYIGPLVTLVCCFLPTKRHTVWDLIR